MVKNVSPTQKTQVRSLAWEDPLGKEMATHSSVLAWRIPRTEEPGGGGGGCPARKVGHDLATAQQGCWKRKWQPAPVFLPGEFHGQRSLVDYSPWGGKNQT